MKYNEPNVDYTKKVHANAPTVKDVEEIAKKIVASSQAGGGEGIIYYTLTSDSGDFTEEEIEFFKQDNVIVKYTDEDDVLHYLIKSTVDEENDLTIYFREPVSGFTQDSGLISGYQTYLQIFLDDRSYRVHKAKIGSGLYLHRLATADNSIQMDVIAFGSDKLLYYTWFDIYRKFENGKIVRGVRWYNDNGLAENLYNFAFVDDNPNIQVFGTFTGGYNGGVNQREVVSRNSQTNFASDDVIEL